MIHKNGMVTIWSNSTNSIRIKNRSDLSETSKLTKLKLLKNKDYFLSVLSDGCFSIWNAYSFEYLIFKHINSTSNAQKVKAHNDNITCIKEFSEGRLATGSKDSSIRLWDLNTGLCIKTLNGHTKKVNCLKVMCDNQFLISSSSDKTIRVWDLKSYDCVCSINLDHSVTTLKLMKHSFELFVGTKKIGIICINLLNFKQPRETGRLFEKQKVKILKFTLKRDLLSVYQDNTIKIWNLNQKRCVSTHNHDDNVDKVKVFSNGQIFISSLSLVIKILNEDYDLIQVLTFGNDLYPIIPPVVSHYEISSNNQLSVVTNLQIPMERSDSYRSSHSK